MPKAKAKKTSAKATKKTTAKKPARAKAEPTAKKTLSALGAAAQVLTESGGSMTTKELIEAMAAQKLWQSPNGQTPAQTLYAALLREINTKGADSRFQKTEPGKFAATSKVEAPTAEKPTAKGTKGKTAKGTKKPAEAPTIPGGTPEPESL